MESLFPLSVRPAEAAGDGHRSCLQAAVAKRPDGLFRFIQGHVAEHDEINIMLLSFPSSSQLPSPSIERFTLPDFTKPRQLSYASLFQRTRLYLESSPPLQLLAFCLLFTLLFSSFLSPLLFQRDAGVDSNRADSIW